MTIPPSFSCENATSLYTREAFLWFSPYNLVLSFLLVGDDILGVPSIKISFCLKGPSRTPVPTGYGENFDILIVGEDIILPLFMKNLLHFARTTGGRPYRFNFYLNICLYGSILYAPEEEKGGYEIRPYGLFGIYCFACRTSVSSAFFILYPTQP